MESLSSRLKSFNKSKSSKSSKSNAKGWPHPANFAANPNTLADAGFYFNPSADDPDNVVCFMCEKELGGWEEEDNPFDIHVEKCPKCPWAIGRCSLENDLDAKGNFVFKKSTRLPSDKTLEKARLETFGGKRKWWPHDSNKSHGATSKKLANAGFVYTPQESGVHDDTATCFYCDLSLSGWDPEDDPITEHKKREERSGKNCPFFASDISTKPPASKSTNGTRRSKAAASKTSIPDTTVLSSSGADDIIVASRATTKQTKERVPANTHSKAGEDGDHEKPLAKKPTRAKKLAKQTLTEEDEEGKSVKNVPQTQSTKQASKRTDTKTPAKKNKKAAISKGNSDESQEVGNERGRPKIKPTSLEAQSEASGKSAAEYEDYVVAMDEDDDKRKSESKPPPTRARLKSKSRTDGERSTSRASTKSHTRSRSKTAIVTEDVPGDILITAGTSQLRKSTRTRKDVPTSKAGNGGNDTTSTRPRSPDAVPSDVDMQIDDQRPDSPDGTKPIGASRTAKTHPGQKKIPMEDRSNTSYLKDDPQPMAHKSAQSAPAPTLISSKDRPSALVTKESLHIRSELARPAEGVSSSQVQGHSSQHRDMDVDVEVVLRHPETPTRQRPAMTPPPTTVQPHTISQPNQHPTVTLDLPAPFLPPLAEYPMKYTTALSEAERSMTVEEYIRYEMSRELERLRLDGQRTIDNFRMQAAEVRARIEAL